MGIALEYQSTKVGSTNFPPWSGFPYYSISLSLNIPLTLMIVVRLILHARNIRTALEGTGIGGLCKAIITMLIESCVLYAVSSLLVIAPWGASSRIAYTFLPILDQTQVRAFPWPRSLGRLSNVMTGLARSSLRCSSFNGSPTRAR